MKQCEKCGQPIPEGSAFCTNCGAAVSNTEQPPMDPAPDPAGAPVPPAPINQPTGPAAPETPVPPVPPAPAQPFGPMPPQAPPVAPAPKQSNGKMIAMAVACVVCLAVGITGIVMALTGNSNSGSNNGGNNSPSGNEDPSSGNGGAYVPNTGDTKVSYAGYEFSLPASYDYEFYDNDSGECLSISDSPNEYIADICYYNDVTFTNIKNNIDTLKSMMEDHYGTVVVSGTKTIEGKDYIYFDIGKVGDEINGTIIESAADLYYFETAVTTNIGVSGTDYIENVAEVLGTAQKKKGASKSLGGDRGLNPIKAPGVGTMLENQ